MDILGRPPKVTPGVILLLQVPRTNEKKELAAEQLFASLHGLLWSGGRSPKTTCQRISLEIAVQAKKIGFYIWVPAELVSFVEEQIYAQYPSVQITQVPDYTTQESSDVFAHQLTAELKFIKNDVLPIRTFPSFEVDPLAAITATLAEFSADESAWIQVLIKPASKNWHKKTERYINQVHAGHAAGLTTNLSTLWAPPDSTAKPVSLKEHQRIQVAGAEEKSQKLAYELAVRMVYRGSLSDTHARQRVNAMVASFKQFNTTYMNGFAVKYISPQPACQQLFRLRQFKGPGFNCNIEEIASLYHLPHTSVETPNIMWAASATAEPPATLPTIEPGQAVSDRSPIAATNFRGKNIMFGLLRSDRSRHLYIIGQTGTGKSGLLELLTMADINSPYGFAVIDPHGDYAMNILRRIPTERIKDVIYFNPADSDFPIAFNPLEVTDPKLRTHTVSELIGVLKRMFESWGPRLEYILRYTLLALVEYPGATMLDITRMLTDKRFRRQVLDQVSDPVVINFWTVEFASWNDKFAAEAVAPVLNKVGAFTANPIVRNIIGQPKSSINLRQVMDQRKILVVNLSRGLIGEDNAALLGALMVTKIQMAAMSRADIGQSERTPFYLYVDEFQNFATDSFATILSEARKYGLVLTVANQYIAQMMSTVKDAVFGNVGSIISFRSSADDARTMTRYFEPTFTEHDLVHMHNRHFVTSLTIGGEKVPAFSGFSLNLPPLAIDHSQEIVNNCRQRYATQRANIESFMVDHYQAPKKVQSESVQPPAHSLRELGAPVTRLANQLTSPPIEQPAASPPIKRHRKRHHKPRRSSVATVPIAQMTSQKEAIIHLH